MKKINKLEKSYVDFLKNEVREFNAQKKDKLNEIAEMYKNGIVNSDSEELMWDDVYKEYETNIENILCMAISRSCCYKSLYGITRVAFFDEYATDFLNDIIYRVKEAQTWDL